MELLKSEVQPIVEKAVQGLGIDPSLVGRMLQSTRELDQGDLSLPCFPFAKLLGKAPADIAEAIRAAMPEHEASGEVGAVNGYLNVRASTVWLADRLLKNGVSPTDERQPREVLIEHTSANPNGPFHVGRARNAILGDSLVRLHRLWGGRCARRVLRRRHGEASCCAGLGA